MYNIELGKTGLSVPTIAIGCMRLNGLDKAGAGEFINTAMENGANFFDHADIYGGGECEELFADAVGMTPSVREKMIIQSKCGIGPGETYDFSKEHILSSVDGILKRLKTEYLDVLLLHRPDALVEPEEVAEAFETLKSSGKVRHFGVSNQNSMQIQLLQKYLTVPIAANQLQLSIAHSTMISAGMTVNMDTQWSVDRDGGVLDFCRLNDITIQPWSPFQQGFFGGSFIDSENYPELNKCLAEIGEKYGVSKTAVSMAWLLRHPAKFQPVIGTMNIKRLLDCIKATQIRLSRSEWYKIHLSAGNIRP